MSNEKFERYKELYSKYLEHAIELHNYHQVFIKRKGVRPGKQVRIQVKAIIKLEKELWKASIAAYEECLENYKLQYPHNPNRRKGKENVNKFKSKKPV